MGVNGPLPFQLDDHAKATQAVDSLAGYIHQIYHSINAWINLRDSEILFIEVREDYAIWARNILSGVQIKHSEDSISLGTKETANAITSHWEAQKANPGVVVKTVFVTTSTVRHEQSSRFPNGIPGIEYWIQCQSGKLDTRPIRDALMRLALSSDLKNFISSSTDDDFRNKMLGVIEWVCKSPKGPSLRRLIEDRVIIHGSSRGITSIDSLNAIAAIAKKFIDTSILPSPADRRLSLADFIRTFDSQATVTVSKSLIPDLLAAQMRAIPVGATVCVDPRKLSENSLFPRKALAQSVAKSLSSGRSLWIFGESGIGKTDLAIKVSRILKNDSLLIPKRSHAPSSIADRYAEIISNVNPGSATGVIIDAIGNDLTNEDILYLKSIHNHIITVCGGWCMITATALPPASLQDIFSKPIKVPNLTAEEIRDAIVQAGGDGEKWTTTVYRESWFGNPSLAHIRIVGLRKRGWPAEEIANPLSPIDEHWDIKRARQEARNGIVKNYPAEAVALLAKLSVVGGVFDRRLANAIGGPGAHYFDTMAGPYIVQITDELYALSPLMRGAPEEWGISESEATRIRGQIIGDIIARKIMTSYLVKTLLYHSLITKSATGIMTVGIIIWQCPNEHFAYLAKDLRVDMILPTYNTVEFIPGNAHASIMLRIAQYKVASQNKYPSLNIIANRLLLESPKADINGAHPMYMIAIMKILFDRNLYIRPNQWMSLVRRLSSECAILEGNPLFPKTAKVDGLSGADISFMSRIHMLMGTQDLTELIHYLDQVPPEERSNIFAPLEFEGVLGNSILMQAGWHKDCSKQEWNPSETLIKYNAIKMIVSNWDNEALHSQCIIAIATLHDEYLNDNATAEIILRDRIAIRGHDVPVERHLARVLFHEKRDKEALEILERVLPETSLKNYSDRFFIVREGIIASDRIDSESSLWRFLDNGIKTVASKNAPTFDMRAGLFLERALYHRRRGEIKDSLGSLLQALEFMENYSEDGDIGERYRVKIFMNLVENIGNRNALLPVGSPSNPDPHKLVMDLPPGTIFGNWYMGAMAEFEHGVRVGFLDRVKLKMEKASMPSLDYPLVRLIVSNSILNGDATELFTYAARLNCAIRYLIKHRNAMEEVSRRGMAREISIEEYWREGEDGGCEGYRDAVLSFIFMRALSGGNIADLDPIALGTSGKSKSYYSAAKEMISYAMGNVPGDRTIWSACAFYVSRLQDFSIEVGDLFVSHCAVSQWLCRSIFASSCGLKLWKHFRDRWMFICANRGFSLNSPALVEAAIREVADQEIPDAKKVLSLCLALEAHSGKSLASNLRDEIRSKIR
jgi:hypothetical protein